MRGSLAERQKGTFAISFVFNIAVSGCLLLSSPTLPLCVSDPLTGVCAHGVAFLCWFPAAWGAVPILTG
jgi:hypothetical protein